MTDDRSSHGAGGDAGATWSILPRERFEEMWLDLPALTVLTAAPGWGRTTWMRQCRALREESFPERPVIWVSTRRGLLRTLDDIDAGEARTVTVFVDDVLLTRDDDLWDRVAATSDGGATFVVSALDEPSPARVLAARSRRIVDERELRFDDGEIDELLRISRAPRDPTFRHRLTETAKGCPFLVRTLIELNRRRIADRRSLVLDAPVEDALVSHVLEHLTADQLSQSAFFRFIDEGAGFRRFTPAMLDSGESDAERLYLVRMFARMRASPLGRFDVDEVSGLEQFVWTAASWRRFAAEETAQETRDRLERAQRFVIEHEGTGLRLFYALELGDLALADRLALHDFRYYQRRIGTETRERLLDLPYGILRERPSLLHLASDIRLRREGPNPLSARGLREFLDVARVTPDAAAFDRFRLLARRTSATVALGDRAGTVELLRRVVEHLDDDTSRGVIAQVHDEPPLRSRLATELYLPYWAATQVDDHELALRLAALAAGYATDFEQASAEAAQTLATQQDFSGLRSLDLDGVLDDEAAHDTQALSFFSLETGDDADAALAMRALAEIPRITTVRSAGDGYLLMVRALAAPQGLEPERIHQLIEINRAFWSDGHPSTFTAFGATCAFLALGRPDSARALWSEGMPEDWFRLTATGLLHLNTGEDGSAAVAFAAAVEQTTLPRTRVIANVLLVAALLRVGRTQAGRARLETQWMSLPAPRLLRFALRFVSDDDFARVQALPGCPTGLRRVIAAAGADRRNLHGVAAPVLSAVELEVVALMRAGRTNAEIAAHRFVSDNTVRTQVRGIFRKLGVNDRASAVAAAERFGLLDGV